MPAVLVVVGLALTVLGYALERQQTSGFTRGKAVGLALFAVGEILLFGVEWWWALIGLAVPPILIGVLLAPARRR